MRALEVCAGIGGLTLALEMAGFETAGLCELDPRCRLHLAEKWPHVPIFGDFTKLTDGQLIKAGIMSVVQVEWLASFNEDGMSNWTKMNPSQADEAAALYERGLSLAEVSGFYGVTRQSMHALLRKRGVAMRPQLRFGEDNHFYRNGRGSVRGPELAAEKAAWKALSKGVISRPDECQDCGCQPGKRVNGASMLEMHHDDYNKPLDVRWLCKACHFSWHKENEPVRAIRSVHSRRGEDRDVIGEIDLLAGGIP